MKQKISLLAILLLCFLATSQKTYAQEVSKVRIEELTDDQVMQLMTEITKLGLTMDEAANLARVRGASDEQIKAIMGRILETNWEKELQDTTKGLKDEGSKLKDEEDWYSKKEPIDTVVAKKKIFGFDLFNSENLTFEPSINIQTPKEYMVGIGDEFVINVWGASEAMYQSKVSKNGAIQIPQIGPIYVNGLSFEKAEKLIKNRLTRIHGGMKGENPNTYAIINLEGMMSLQVNIVGMVMTPGSYTLPATASLFNALYLSGGPNEFGSYRKIQLIRDGKIFKEIDIYNFLVHADPSQNIPLRDQDMIFIPRYERRVIVEGEFVRTGLFEMKDDETLVDLMNFNAGFADKAYKNRVFVHQQTVKEMEVKDVMAENFSQYIVQGGDSVIAESIIERYANRVKIGGAVFRSGSYELEKGMTLVDLIKKAEGIREDAYMHRGQIFRLNHNIDTLTLAFNVTDVMAGKEIIKLLREDSVSIKSVSELHEEYFVEIEGEVNDPGEKSFYDKMTVQDLIFLAGGFSKDADVKVIEIARRLSPEEADTLNENLGHVFTVSIERDLSPNSDSIELVLEPFDRVLVRKAMGFRDQGNVSITGEVRYVGYFSIKTRKDRISDLINWSGGLTPDAYPDAAHLFKEDSSLVDIDLEWIIKNPGDRLDMILEPGDSLDIPKEPQTISIVGQVQAPFAPTYIPGKTVKYYVKNAGGWADDPDRSKIYVIHPDGSAQNTKSFILRRYPKLRPGSIIIIPKKPVKQKKDNSALLLATASTMGSLGIMVVTMINLLKTN